MRKFIVIILLSISFTLITGCVGGQAEMQRIVQLMQEKPKPPRSEIAIVVTESTQTTDINEAKYKFILKKVDKHDVTPDRLGVELPPGKYALSYEIRYYQPTVPRMWLNKQWYDINVRLRKGERMIVVFDKPNGSSSLCTLLISGDHLFPEVQATDFPSDGNAGQTCVNAGVDLSDSAWIKFDEIPGKIK